MLSIEQEEDRTIIAAMAMGSLMQRMDSSALVKPEMPEVVAAASFRYADALLKKARDKNESRRRDQ